jgi:hypothetical protein
LEGAVRPIAIAIVISIAMVVPTESRAQTEPVLTRTAAFEAEPFTRIRGIQETANGNVLVADQIESAVYLVDFAAGTRTKVGNEGAGPQEYRQPTGLHPFRGDSALLMDLQNSRIAVLDASGRIARTEPLFRPGMSIPTGADRMGNLYWDHTSSLRLAKREDPSADQAPVARFSQATNEIDTLAFLTIPGGVNPSAFPDWDVWAVSLDGRIAIVRNQREYRLDWIEPDGRQVNGSAIPLEPIRVTDRDREVLRAQPGGGRAAGVAMGRGQQASQPRLLDVPEFFPPIKQRGVWIAPDGRAFVERQLSLNDTRPQIDVFDATGRRTAVVRLPESRRIIGMGRSGLYAVRVDGDDLLWLERYDTR